MTGTEAVREYVRLKKLLAAEYSRVKKLTEKLQNLAPVPAEVTDKVTCGKRGKKPLQTLTIHGKLDYSQENAIREKLRRCGASIVFICRKTEELRAGFREFVNGIEPEETCAIFSDYLFIMPRETLPEWQDVADHVNWILHTELTADACRMRFNRYMRQAEKQEETEKVLDVRS